MRVAIIEDNALVGLSLAIALQEAGHEVVGPYCRLDQVEALTEQQAPDVALLDLHVGHGQCGARIGRYLAARFGTTGVYVTADEIAAERDRNHALGYVLKPVSEEEALEVLKYLGSRRLGRANVPVPAKLNLFDAGTGASAARAVR